MYFPCDLFSGRSVTTSECESNYRVATLVLTCQCCCTRQKRNRPFGIDGGERGAWSLAPRGCWKHEKSNESGEWHPPRSGLFVLLLLSLFLSIIAEWSSLGQAVEFDTREVPVIGSLDMNLEGPCLCLLGWLVWAMLSHLQNPKVLLASKMKDSASDWL